MTTRKFNREGGRDRTLRLLAPLPPKERWVAYPITTHRGQSWLGLLYCHEYGALINWTTQLVRLRSHEMPHISSFFDSYVFLKQTMICSLMQNKMTKVMRLYLLIKDDSSRVPDFSHGLLTGSNAPIRIHQSTGKYLFLVTSASIRRKITHRWRSISNKAPTLRLRPDILKLLEDREDALQFFRWKL